MGSNNAVVEKTQTSQLMFLYFLLGLEAVAICFLFYYILQKEDIKPLDAKIETVQVRDIVNERLSEIEKERKFNEMYEYYINQSKNSNTKNKSK